MSNVEKSKDQVGKQKQLYVFKFAITLVRVVTGHSIKPFNLDIDMYKAQYDLKLQSHSSILFNPGILLYNSYNYVYVCDVM